MKQAVQVSTQVRASGAGQQVTALQQELQVGREVHYDLLQRYHDLLLMTYYNDLLLCN